MNFYVKEKVEYYEVDYFNNEFLRSHFPERWHKKSNISVALLDGFIWNKYRV